MYPWSQALLNRFSQDCSHTGGAQGVKVYMLRVGELVVFFMEVMLQANHGPYTLPQSIYPHDTSGFGWVLLGQ